MTTIRTDALLSARRFFDAGVLALGFDVGAPGSGGRTPHPARPADRDPGYARRAFTRAAQLAPALGDAWLGLAAVGDLTPDTLFSLYRSRDTLGIEQRRLGLPPGTLGTRFGTGFHLDHPLTDAAEAAAAYTAAMIAEADYDGAEQALDDAPDRPIVAFQRGVLHFRTQRWPDVLTALRGAPDWRDETLAAAANMMAGSACAQLGLFTEAVRRLDLVETGPVTPLHLPARFTRGMCARERGDEAAARAIFESVYARRPDFADNARALASPSYRLVVTTREAVDARTDRWDPASVPAGPERSDALGEIVAGAEAELARQVGLTEVKEQVARLTGAARMANLRAERGLPTAGRSYHLAFTGPPGTGKTSIARIVAKLFHGLGVLASDTVVEASRRDFVGEHLGATALKTGALIDSALDGVLFIDEAYTLIQSGLSGGDAFGREALDTLLARMENDRDRLVVIIAGYDAEIDRFLAANEGLASRFARRIRFPSYSPDELGAIGEVLADGRGSRLTPEAREALVAACAEIAGRQLIDAAGAPRPLIDVAGNGRFVRNVVEAAEEEREFRLCALPDPSALDEAALTRIEPADIKAAVATVLGMLAR